MRYLWAILISGLISAIPTGIAFFINGSLTDTVTKIFWTVFLSLSLILCIIVEGSNDYPPI